MLELSHTIVGAAIAAKIGNPALALPLSLASHFALDLVPHWNPHLNTEIKKYGRLKKKTLYFIGLDVLASLIAGFFLAAQYKPDIYLMATVLLGGLMGVLPDLVESPHFLFNKRWEPIEKLIKFQKSIQNDAHPIIGISTQVIIVSAALWWFFH